MEFKFDDVVILHDIVINHCEKNEYISFQKEMEKGIQVQVDAIMSRYASIGLNLKLMLKSKIREALNKTNGKLAFILMDIQNDFVLKSSNHYIDDAQSVVISNMALLDAIMEVVNEELVNDNNANEATQVAITDRIEIITTQKAIDWKDVSETEDLYVRNCMRGTIGVGIPALIKEKLTTLSSSISVHHFANDTHASMTALLLRKNIDITDARYLTPDEGIFDDQNITLENLLTDRTYAHHFISGLANDDSLKSLIQDLANLNNDSSKVSVVEPCIHYNIRWNSDYEQESSAIIALCKANNFEYLQSTEAIYRANPDYLSDKQLQEMLDKHKAAQEVLRPLVKDRYQELESYYKKHGEDLKNAMKLYLISELDVAKGKVGINLIDIQNDFVLKDFPAYVHGAENVVFSNMALLDAIAELIADKETSALQNIEIITSQDIHYLFKNGLRLDFDLMALSGLGNIQTMDSIAGEYDELRQINIDNDQFGLHCIRGTIGVAIPQPILQRLYQLSLSIPVHPFGKIGPSSVRSGMKLIKDIQPELEVNFNPEIPLYSESKEESYPDFIKERNYNLILLTGCLADYSIKNTAVDLAASGQIVKVVDPCVHYRVPKNKTLPDVRNPVLSYFDDKKVSYVTAKKNKTFRANPELIGYEEALAFSVDSNLQAVLEQFHTKVTALEQQAPEKILLGTLSSNLNLALEQFLVWDSTKSFEARLENFKFAAKSCIDETRALFPKESTYLQVVVTLLSVLVSICTLGVVNLYTRRNMFTLFQIDKNLGKNILDTLDKEVDQTFEPTIAQ